MKERFRARASEKQALGMVQECKRLDLLCNLKEEGGPFTCAEKVDIFLSSQVNENMKKRMKLEIKYARNSSKLAKE